MEKKIEDYLHLMIGQILRIDFGKDNCLSDRKYGDYEIIGYNKLDMGLQVNLLPVGMTMPMWYDWKEDYKIILRPLSDMTEREFTDVCKMLNWNINEYYDVDWFISEYTDEFIRIGLIHSFELTKYLLSKSFDLFNLIDAGLAINKTKL